MFWGWKPSQAIGIIGLYYLLKIKQSLSCILSSESSKTELKWSLIKILHGNWIYKKLRSHLKLWFRSDLFPTNRIHWHSSLKHFQWECSISMKNLWKASKNFWFIFSLIICIVMAPVVMESNTLIQVLLGWTTAFAINVSKIIIAHNYEPATYNYYFKNVGLSLLICAYSKTG